ncbi:MAG: dihydroorotase [Chloroflexota bacterium]
MSELWIINGRLVDPSQGVDGPSNLRIVEGRVDDLGRIEPPGDLPAERLIDAGGRIVSPGFVDIHVHLRQPGYEEKETIATGTRAAAAGGFTTVCAMPNTRPTIDTRADVEFVLEMARREGVVRVFTTGSVTKGQKGEELSELGEMVEAGAVAFTDDGHVVANPKLMRYALEYARMLGRPVAQHCEDPEMSAGGLMHEGRISALLGLRGLPAAAEESIVARDIALSRLTGGHIHFQHVSTAGSVELIRAAREEGLPVTAEVTPHHLTLTEDWVAGGKWTSPTVLERWGRIPTHPYDTNTRVAPPLRSESDVQLLLAALKDGLFDAIATDHAPHTIVDKQCEYGMAASGISGLETALGALLTLVHRGELDLSTMIRYLTVEPARVLKLPYGTLRKGADADITIFDPDAEWTVDPARFLSKGKNSPLAGATLRGKVWATLVGGRVAFKTDS